MSLTIERAQPENVRRQIDWQKAAKITGKILVVALLVAAFAAATYFTAGAAVLLLAKGASLAGGFTAFTALTLGASTLAVPVLAGAHKMYRATKETSRDIARFTLAVAAFAAIGWVAYLYVHHRM